MKRFVLMMVFLFDVTFSSAGLAKTLTVANNGTDSPSCGGSGVPCRSISQAILNASNGDNVVVGPGEYGNREFGPATGCCAIVIDKEVSITARDGATATVINVRDTGRWPVIITASNALFGGKNKGFMVVADTNPPFSGIFVKEGTSAVTVQGNTFVGFGRGIDVAGDNGIIANNVVTENGEGLDIHGNNNTAIENIANGNPGVGGIVVGGNGHVISRNICNANTFTGIRVTTGSGHQITDNSVIGNGNEGILLESGVRARVTGNSLFATASN